MPEQRILIIGDIHGCLGMLRQMMDKIAWNKKKDRLIFVGDYIDRGEDPYGVVEYLICLARQSGHVDFLLGNHEAMLMDYLNGTRREMYLYNGGRITIASYKAHMQGEGKQIIPEDHMAFYKRLKPYIELEDYYVVHAGFRPGVPIEEQTTEDMIWIRDEFIYSDYDFGKRVIFGHTWFKSPFIQKNKIGIDTGAVYGNQLTCLELPGLRFHHVHA